MAPLPRGLTTGLIVGGVAAVAWGVLADRRLRAVLAGQLVEMVEPVPYLGARVRAFFADQQMEGIYRAVAEDVVSQSKSGEMLVLGSGTGRLAVELAMRACDLQVTTMDPTPYVVQMAEARIYGSGLGRQAKVVHGEGSDIPYPEGSFDAALSVGGLHQWKTPELVLAEIHRVLRPGGKAWLYDLRREMPEEGWDEVREKLPAAEQLLLDVGPMAAWRSAYSEGEIAALAARSPFGQASTSVLTAEIAGAKLPALVKASLQK